MEQEISTTAGKKRQVQLIPPVHETRGWQVKQHEPR